MRMRDVLLIFFLGGVIALYFSKLFLLLAKSVIDNTRIVQESPVVVTVADPFGKEEKIPDVSGAGGQVVDASESPGGKNGLNG